MASANWMMKERMLVYGGSLCAVSEIATENVWVGGLIIHLMKQKDLKKRDTSLTLNCHIS